MKKSMIAKSLFALTLITTGVANANITTTYKYSPNTSISDGNDSSKVGGYTFDLSGLGYSSISNFVLTLNLANISNSINTEHWYLDPIPNLISSFSLSPTSLSGGFSQQKFTFSTVSNSDMFSTLVNDALFGPESFSYAFNETTNGADAFSLGYAKLEVTGVQTVPEPETYTLLLAGLGLMGTGACRRKQV